MLIGVIFMLTFVRNVWWRLTENFLEIMSVHNPNKLSANFYHVLRLSVFMNFLTDILLSECVAEIDRKCLSGNLQRNFLTDILIVSTP